MIYLDNAATTKVKNQVKDLVIRMLQNDVYGNPSSAYEFGLNSKRIIENARNIIAGKINANPNEIIFTSGASASNALAICGYLNSSPFHFNFATTNIEHSSILDIDVFGKYKHIEQCDRNGFLHPEQFKRYKNCLISVQAANNEIGTIQPIKEIAEIVHGNCDGENKNNILHSDLTQYIPYYKVDVKDMGLDMASFSAHKLGGLKGTGVLYVKNGIHLSPIIHGSQEKGLFAGTENIYGIAALGKAFELLSYSEERNKELGDKRNYLLNLLLKSGQVHLNGDLSNRLPNNVNIRIGGLDIDNHSLIALLDMNGYCVSSGSACHSSNNKPSHVLKALGLTNDEINHSIRITISEDTTYEDIRKFCIVLQNIISYV